MKELSIEEKAKAYDDALKKAKEWYDNPNSATIGKAYLFAVFPELSESKDEKIRKRIIALVNAHGQGMYKDEMLDWLEKQGEQKPIDKVEPKFHEGEWIVFNGLTLHVNEVVQGYYRTTSINGITNSYDWNIDNLARLWTIQEAKDGDVLKEDSCIFIIQKLGDNSTEAKTYCTLYNDGDFDDGSILYFDKNSTKPATKEQRDTLMKAMADAGWEFDFEKKELKKIEQKPSWSKEDESILQGIWDEILANKHNAKEYEWKTYDKFLNWLESLKDRVQPKQEWNKEVSPYYDDICEILINLLHSANANINKDAVQKDLDWLKSLKERYTWKPSDEQMKVLDIAIKAGIQLGTWEEKALRELKEQLKKL